MTITGSGFTGATAVDFGTNPATSLTVVSDTTITVDSPAGTGTVDVTVTTPGGTSATSPADQFTYWHAGGHGREPDSVRRPAARLVTITGSGFTGATAVDFGTTPATNLTVVSDTSITVDSPAGTGTVDVTVTTPGGTSATSAADQFTLCRRAVTGMSPTLVRWRRHIGDDHRSGFTGATAVDFGTMPATSLTVVSDTTITVDSPAGTGTVNVTVTTPSGTSATIGRRSIHLLAPRCRESSPTAGPLAGGTLVTITGSGFTAPRRSTSARTGDGIYGRQRYHDHSGQPGGRPGTVDVTVTTPSRDVGHIAPPICSTISARRWSRAWARRRSSGRRHDGDDHGSGFTGATAVDFGTTPATDFTVVSDTTITAASPAGTGTVNVTVTTAGRNVGHVGRRSVQLCRRRSRA